ncbi:MAG: ATP--guanido phosphotransferase [Ruminococcaceae bacterium]|nr:ATP--guanido phosphotransferase [Oscillospiraceae bacterium]
MKWYDKISNKDDVVISSRVRLARNLEGFAFPARMDEDSSKKAALSVKQALENAYGTELEFAQLGNNANLLVEEHVVSPEFADNTNIYRALVSNKDKSLAIMINEEDHVRIQALFPGFDLDAAYECANKADDALIKGCSIAFDEKYGFLTSCPTNLGTGMRASVMLHLPALSAYGYIKSIVSLMNKIGLTVRGIYGEGSDARANMYQLSNQVTLGISEEDTIEKLKSAVLQIVDRERNLRKKLLEDTKSETYDKLWRSYGTLKYARRIDTNEASKLISNVRLAQVCGIIPEIKDKNLIKLLFEIMPSHIVSCFPDALDSSLRDKYRADLVRQFLQ